MAEELEEAWNIGACRSSRSRTRSSSRRRHPSSSIAAAAVVVALFWLIGILAGHWMILIKMFTACGSLAGLFGLSYSRPQALQCITVLCVTQSLGSMPSAQRTQYPLIKEYTLNYRGLNNMI